MASFYLRTQTGLACHGAGKKHSRYISGLDKYAHKKEVKHVVDGNLPSFANDAVEFFDQADKNERANGRSYRSIVFAIPREAKDKLAWAQELTNAMLDNKHTYRLAIHLDDEGHNPHAHLQFSERGLIEGETVKDFFSRANPKEKKISGTASKRWLADMKDVYLGQIKKLVPTYVRPNSKEQKIGQKREIKTEQDQKYENERQAREQNVQNIRLLSAGLAECEAAIEFEKLAIEEAKQKQAKPAEAPKLNGAWKPAFMSLRKTPFDIPKAPRPPRPPN